MHNEVIELVLAIVRGYIIVEAVVLVLPYGVEHRAKGLGQECGDTTLSLLPYAFSPMPSALSLQGAAWILRLNYVHSAFIYEPSSKSLVADNRQLRTDNRQRVHVKFVGEIKQPSSYHSRICPTHRFSRECEVEGWRLLPGQTTSYQLA